MDWSAVAFLLSERAKLPAVLLGGRGELLLVAPAATQALGWRCEDGQGDWADRCIAPPSAATGRWVFEKALAGALRTFEVAVRTTQGTALARFDASPVGNDDGKGVLLLLEELVPLVRQDTSADYDYEVSGVTTGQYRLERTWKPGLQGMGGTGRCYEVLHARSAPCSPCPLSPGARDRGGVVVSMHGSADYVLTAARSLSADAARVSVRRLPLASLAAVLEARLDELAGRAELSKRERAVFGKLMDGRAVDDIALELSISPRTVKFHQANLLQKLGADSRVDLMRLLF